MFNNFVDCILGCDIIDLSCLALSSSSSFLRTEDLGWYFSVLVDHDHWLGPNGLHEWLVLHDLLIQCRVLHVRQWRWCETKPLLRKMNQDGKSLASWKQMLQWHRQVWKLFPKAEVCRKNVVVRAENCCRADVKAVVHIESLLWFVQEGFDLYEAHFWVPSKFRGFADISSRASAGIKTLVQNAKDLDGCRAGIRLYGVVFVDLCTCVLCTLVRWCVKRTRSYWCSATSFLIWITTVLLSARNWCLTWRGTSLSLVPNARKHAYGSIKVDQKLCVIVSKGIRGSSVRYDPWINNYPCNIW